jgi:hypothetical protein
LWLSVFYPDFSLISGYEYEPASQFYFSVYFVTLREISLFSALALELNPGMPIF